MNAHNDSSITLDGKSAFAVTVIEESFEKGEDISRKPSTLERVESALRPELLHLLYLFVLVALIVACVVFWTTSRYHPILFSWNAAYNYQSYAKEFTFMFTLLGTVLTTITMILFNMMLSLAVRQNLQGPGVAIGRIEFWSKLSMQKMLFDFKRQRIHLSLITVIFALTAGILTSAYTGLVTPQQVYVRYPLNGHDLDLGSPAFKDWYAANSAGFQEPCGFYTYDFPNGSITLSTCPFDQDPGPLLAAGQAALSYGTVQVSGFAFGQGTTYGSGTTAGCMPLGWNGPSAFNNIDNSVQADMISGLYNYSLVQQGLSVDVQCQAMNGSSNIIWTRGEKVLTLGYNSAQPDDIFTQHLEFRPPNSNGSEFPTNATIISDDDFVASFVYQNDSSPALQMELAPFGSYATHYSFPNMTCTITPSLPLVNVTYSGSTGQFSAVQGAYAPNGTFDPSLGTNATSKVPIEVLQAASKLFTQTSWFRGNGVVDAMISGNNTNLGVTFSPSGYEGLSLQDEWSYVTSSFVQGVTEYYASYFRLLAMAQIRDNMTSAFQRDLTDGFAESWALGYQGALLSAATLFPLQFVILLGAIVLFCVGSRAHVKHVAAFNPMNTTCLIVASAEGGKNSGLTGWQMNGAPHTNEDVLATHIRYHEAAGQLQQVEKGTELRNLVSRG